MKLCLMASVATVILVLPVAAVAQSAEAEPLGAPEPETRQPVDSGEIIVTAQKRSERLLDVPMSISAIGGDDLTSSGIQNMANLQQTTPGLVTVNTGFGFVPIIRGIASTGTSPGDATNVALYLDDISLGAPIAGIFDLADIERIEVLKGPQGTLFGRNATGGAIRIFTRKPSFEASGNLSADYGFHYGDLKLNGFVTGPLTDTLAASVSATLRRGNGFIKGIGLNEGRKYGEPRNYLVRGKLLFQPTDGVEAILSADSWRQQNNQTFISSVKNEANPYPGPGSLANGFRTYAGDTQPKADLRGRGATLDVSADIGNITARSITGYREVEIDSLNDADRTNQPIAYLAIGQYEKSFSQELNLSGPVDSPLSWIAGAYYLHSNAGNPYFRQGTGTGPNGPTSTDFTNRVSVRAGAVYGELTWNPSEQFHLTGGLRYSTETKKFRFREVVRPGGLPLRNTDTEKTWDSTTFRVVGRYDLGDAANIYASVSTGFKSGVYNSYSFLDNPVDPEKVTAYEIGGKARVGGITFTAAAYRYDYRDIQLSAHVSIDGQLLVTLSNAASARMEGLEFTASGRLAEGLTFDAGLGWQPTGKYIKYSTAQVVVPIPGATGALNKMVVVPFDASRSRVARNPETTANLRLNYEAAVAGGELKATASGSYTSSFFWQPANLTKENAYFLLNGRVSWTDSARRITYSIFGNNLTDAVYHTDSLAATRGDDSVRYPEGREFGVGVSIAF